MSSVRLSKATKELNISLDRAVEELAKHGHEIPNNRNHKITNDQYEVLMTAFADDLARKKRSEEVSQQVKEEKEILRGTKDTAAAPAEEAAPEPASVEEAPVVEAPKEVAPEKPAPAPEEVPAAAPTVEAVPEVEVTKEIEVEAPKESTPDNGGLKVMGKIDLDAQKPKKKEAPAKPKKVAPTKKSSGGGAHNAPKPVEPTPAKEEVPQTPQDQEIKTKYVKIDGPKFTGQKIVLPVEKPKENKKKRTRIKKQGPGGATPAQNDPKNRNNTRGPQKRGPAGGRGRKQPVVAKQELTDEQIQKQIKETLEKLTSGKKNKGAKIRRDKRAERREREELADIQAAEESKVLQVTEFVTVTELANMMDVSVNEVIGSLMGVGVMVTMNQRLDAEMLEMVAEEFGFSVNFVDEEVTESFLEEEDNEEDLKPRSPIVTVMGHVDHGKTSLLDYVRKANVIAGEAGGITQHIGAYSVKVHTGQTITFLDTPGHEAFTAMRARGAQVTDIAIIVVAADDAVMPQTKEAISHAQAAGVPIVIAINKVDRDVANPNKIKEQLAQENVLVEDWGGSVQCQEISAKTGLNIEELLDKVILEAEMLDLKANPSKNASGTIVEASLDKGRGYMCTALIQSGTMKVGDYVLAGQHSGKVKAMLDERGNRIKVAGPSTPVNLLGLDGAPTSGDRFIIMDDEREAKQIAQKRLQLQREQSVRSQKQMTLEEIGRRLKVGDFQELNIILKGDVDGSVEALSDSLQKLTTEEIQVNIIHKGVGQISESDVLLATASQAILVGFQVRPSAQARKLAEKEEVEIRMYSIIYDAINEIRDAMEGMLSAEVKEEIKGTAEIRETFKISKVGTIAGCMVTDGVIERSSDVRIIRDGVVVYTGKLGSLKRFKDDAKEVRQGFECGLNIEKFNDIKVGDVVEAFGFTEVKRTL
ncbi:MAG: Translation initiation factor IF-2 [Flavobacteriales bacterium UBA4585]|nr:MAG: Translation initiation factor IF-2 [Flavobacteriales bacterium UBA4585]